MSRKLELYLHPNKHTSFDLKGWPVRNEAAGLMLVVNGKAIALELDNTKTLKVFTMREDNGDLVDCIQEVKLNI